MIDQSVIIKIMPPIKVDKEEKRKLILETAINVLAEKGIHRTKMADISKQAGFSYGTVYQYFNSQDDLLIEVYNYFIKTLEEKTMEKFIPSEHAKESLQNLVNAMVEGTVFFGNHIIKLFADFWLEGLRADRRFKDAIKNSFLNFHKMLQDVLEMGKKTREFRQDMDSELTAYTIMGVLDGHLLHFLSLQDIMDFKKIIRNSTHLIIKSIESRKK